VQTADKSTPRIENVQVKKVDRQPFIQEVQSDHELKHVDEVSDRSEPHIEAGVTVKTVDREGFLNSVVAAAQEKGVGDDDE